jgi:hypothetical protein
MAPNASVGLELREETRFGNDLFDLRLEAHLVSLKGAISVTPPLRPTPHLPLTAAISLPPTTHLRDNLLYLGLESHIQHPVRLVQHQIGHSL